MNPTVVFNQRCIAQVLFVIHVCFFQLIWLISKILDTFVIKKCVQPDQIKIQSRWRSLMNRHRARQASKKTAKQNQITETNVWNWLCLTKKFKAFKRNSCSRNCKISMKHWNNVWIKMNITMDLQTLCCILEFICMKSLGKHDNLSFLDFSLYVTPT